MLSYFDWRDHESIGAIKKHMVVFAKNPMSPNYNDM